MKIISRGSEGTTFIIILVCLSIALMKNYKAILYYIAHTAQEVCLRDLAKHEN